MTARRLRSSARAAALTLGLLVLATACARVVPPRAPTDEAARRALELLIARWHAFSDLRALADIAVTRAGSQQRFNGVVLARSPTSVRFEALSPLGAPLMLATIHDGRVVAYDATTNEAMVGPADADTTGRVLGLPFDPDDLVGVLAGRPVPPKDLRVVELRAPDDYGPSLNLSGGLHEQRVWMDMTTGVVRRLRMAGGSSTATVTYRFRDDGALAGFAVETALGLARATVDYREIVLDGGVDSERFSLTLPKDAKIQPIR